MRTNQPPRGSPLFAQHVCGCYFVSPERTRLYLPQVSLKSRSAVNTQCFTTTLTQTFHNPRAQQVPEVRYVFPLYDGVTVTGYTIDCAGKVLRGVVKQKDVARKVYQDAVDRGETAGLLESLPAGVFGVTLGNVAADASVVVEITYCGELKHDAGVDGLRYTLPTSVAPRYGEYPGTVLDSNAATQGGISIVVDVDAAQTPIRRIQSPSHPIAVSMGELSRAVQDESSSAPFKPSQASATLSLGTAELASDFIIQIVIDQIGNPRAIVETHPTISNQRAIMTTLIPKFTLKTENPEIVFVADQSGSMRGVKNEALKAALKVFLKSLPLGVRFNICAFGNAYRFLWPTSQAYNESNLEAAIQFVDGFQAAYGGTQILEPITAAFQARLGDLPLELMLLSDGEIWGEQALFEYISKQVHDEKVNARVFAIGIGSDVSHTLIEGVARAGNGFAQFVTTNTGGSHGYEDLDQKIIRMLRAALYAHTRDYQLEVHYDEPDAMDDEDDFELVEKISDCLSIKSDSGPATNSPQKTKTFFDTLAKIGKGMEDSSNPTDRYAHLPSIEEPKIVQAPTTITPLFPFNRSTVYLLLGPESCQRTVRSVTLRAMSAEGPLELDIPVQNIGIGSSVHQLAARKAIQDLEEGRGWLTIATVDSDKSLVKEKFSSRFDELVEREAVRLGGEFQVAGKWTSFVAVDQTQSVVEDTFDFQNDDTRPLHGAMPKKKSAMMASRGPIMAQMPTSSTGRVRRQMMSQPQAFSLAQAQSPGSSGGAGPFAAPAYLRAGSGSTFGYPASSALMSASNSSMASPAFAPPAMRLSSSRPASLFQSAQPSSTINPQQPPAGSQRGWRQRIQSMVKSSGGKEVQDPQDAQRLVEKMRQLIDLQKFSGAWTWSSQLCQLCEINEFAVDKSDHGGNTDVTATILAVAFLEARLGEQSGAWEMVVQKAKDWLGRSNGMGMEKVEELIRQAILRYYP